MNIQEALDEYLVLISDAMVNELFNNRSVASGDLARSIKNNNRVDKTFEGYQAVLTMLWYGEVVDDGTGRGPTIKPSESTNIVKSIESWIRRKNITPPAGFKSPNQFALAIAAKIKREGTRATKRAYPFINNSIDQVKRQFGDALIEKAGYDQITEQLTTAFENSTK